MNQNFKNRMLVCAASFVVFCIFTVVNAQEPSKKSSSGLVSEVVPDPTCGECAVPSVGSVVPLFFSASPGISAEESFFPFLPQEVLNYVQLSSQTLQSPLGQLLKDNFILMESGNFEQAILGFKAIQKSLSRKTHERERALALLGSAAAEFNVTAKKSAQRQLQKLAKQTDHDALARLAGYILARSLEKQSRAQAAKDWYNQVIQRAASNDVLAQAAFKRSQQLPGN